MNEAYETWMRFRVAVCEVFCAMSNHFSILRLCCLAAKLRERCNAAAIIPQSGMHDSRSRGRLMEVFRISELHVCMTSAVLFTSMTWIIVANGSVSQTGS